MWGTGRVINRVKLEFILFVGAEGQEILLGTSFSFLPFPLPCCFHPYRFVSKKVCQNLLVGVKVLFWCIGVAVSLWRTVQSTFLDCWFTIMCAFFCWKSFRKCVVSKASGVQGCQQNRLLLCKNTLQRPQVILSFKGKSQFWLNKMCVIIPSALKFGTHPCQLPY